MRGARNRIRAALAGRRLQSLDQFRGYTVAAMFLVNFVGSYWACPAALRHHNTYCSYADTIMPQFLFAVGFAMRMTIGRGGALDGRRRSSWRMVRRLGGLALLAIVLYTARGVGDIWQQLGREEWTTAAARALKREWFQTLMHIAVTSLWVLPVIRASARVRVAWLIASAALHLWLSDRFNFAWTHRDPAAIDGGPLGFLTWTLPLVFGSLACDWALPAEGRARLAVLFRWSLLLCLAGWGMSCLSRLYDVTEGGGLRASQIDPRLAAHPVWPSAAAGMMVSGRFGLAEPPLTPPPGSRAALARQRWRDEGRGFRDWLLQPAPRPPEDASSGHRLWNYWMMSQRAGTLSYLTFTAGFSGLVFLGFYLLADVRGLQLGVFRTLGRNALAGYVLHMLVADAVAPWVPRDAPGWYLAAACGVFFAIIYAMLAALERQSIFLRL